MPAHVTLRGRGGDAKERQGLGTQVVHQQARGDIGVVRFLFDHHACAHHQRGVDVGLLHPVIEVLQCFLHHQTGIDTLKTFAGVADQRLQPGKVERTARAVVGRDRKGGLES